jgi:hypothetical protein
MTSTMGQIEALPTTYLSMTASSWPELAVLLSCNIYQAAEKLNWAER